MSKNNKTEWDKTKDEVYNPDKHRSTLTESQKIIAPLKIDVSKFDINPSSPTTSDDTTRDGSSVFSYEENIPSSKTLSRQSSADSDSFYTPAPPSPVSLKRAQSDRSDDSEFFSSLSNGANSDLRKVRREIEKKIESSQDSKKQEKFKDMRSKVSEIIKNNKKDRNSYGRG